MTITPQSSVPSSRKLLIGNFRSLRGEHEIPIAELTFLVGENSTGKSSFLAACAAAFAGPFPVISRLSQDPYRLGSFRSIASDGEEYFSIGSDEIVDGKQRRSLITYKAVQHKTTLASVEMSLGESLSVRADLNTSRSKYQINAVVTFKGERTRLSLGKVSAKELAASDAQVVPQLFLKPLLYSGKPAEPLKEIRRHLLPILFSSGQGDGVVSISPIRTKPQRTYDGNVPEDSPDGGHVPFILRSAYQSKSKGAAMLKAALGEFGKSSGLYERVVVKSLRSQATDSFQLLVEKDRSLRTLLDVGYGVSQVLPILTQSLNAPDRSTLLIQQPEVHLHPTSQAELGSFFVSVHKSKNCKFIVETHSDYLIDRIRIEVMRGFDPVKVSILFFEQDSGFTKLHSIGIDARGNFVGAPESFRAFFLREQAEILGF